MLPQAFRNILPEMANTFLTNLKMTSVLNVIAVQELFMAAKTAGANYYKYYEAYLVIAVIYFVLCFVFGRLFLLIEKKMRKERRIMFSRWSIWTPSREQARTCDQKGETAVMAENIISIEDLSKSFGDHEVLRKIDISVDKGEVICIVGSSGSGKSTLLRCINRLEHQTSGRILYHGKEIRDVQREINRYRAKVGMVFQSFNLFNNMTVLENCMCCNAQGAPSL